MHTRLCPCSLWLAYPMAPLVERRPTNFVSNTDVAISPIACYNATMRVRNGPCRLVPLPPEDARACLRTRHDHGPHPDMVLTIASSTPHLVAALVRCDNALYVNSTGGF